MFKIILLLISGNGDNTYDKSNDISESFPKRIEIASNIINKEDQAEKLNSGSDQDLGDSNVVKVINFIDDDNNIRVEYHNSTELSNESAVDKTVKAQDATKNQVVENSDSENVSAAAIMVNVEINESEESVADDENLQEEADKLFQGSQEDDPELR